MNYKNIKSYTCKIGFLIFSMLMILVSKSNAQSSTPIKLPNVCVTPPTGYSIDGNFQFGEIACMPYGSSSVVVPITSMAPALTNIKFGFVSSDVVDIASPSYNAETPILSAGSYVLNKSLTKGYYYVIQTGINAAGRNVIKCQPLEVVSLEKPSITASVCTPNEITLTIAQASENNHSQYKINWGFGTPEVINITSTTTFPIVIKKPYTGAVVPSVSATGIYIRNNNEVCKPSLSYIVSVVDPSPVTVTELNGENEGAGATIKFKNHIVGLDYELLVTEDKPSPGAAVSMGIGKNGNGSVTGLDPTKKYCFQVASKNACGVYTKSNTVCSIKLTPTLQGSSIVNLDWNIPTEPLSAPNRLSLERNTIGCGPTCFSANLFSSTTTKTYEDKTLECIQKYQYQIISRHNEIVNGVATTIFIRSAVMLVDPKANAKPITPNDLTNVSFDPSDENVVRLDILTSIPGRTYEFYRSEGQNGDFIPIGKSDNNFFEDVSVEANKVNYCYRFKYTDACGLETNLSSPVCTIFLKSESPGTLNWSPFKLPTDVVTNSTKVEYSVEFFNPISGAFEPLPGSSIVLATIQNIQSALAGIDVSEVKFRIVAKQFVDTENYVGQFISSLSNTYTIIVPPSVFVPTVFTPNGDSSNDEFKPTTKFVQEGNMVIYDRWGGIIFQTEDIVSTGGWDGKESNKITEAPPGNYPYKIKGVSTTGEKFEKYGSILLVR